MSVQQREQLRKANLDIVHLKQELGIDDTPLRIDDTPAEDFERFLEESNQLTPKAVRAAELQYKASEDELLQQDFEEFMQQTGQLPVPVGAKVDAAWQMLKDPARRQHLEG